jgi:hypothetical protein
MTRALAVLAAALSLAGCSAQVTQQLQAGTAEDQAATVAVANAAKDYDMQLCAGAMSSIAQVQCPTNAVACPLAKAYEVEQATAHSCAAVEQNAKAAFGQLLINLGLTP